MSRTEMKFDKYTGILNTEETIYNYKKNFDEELELSIDTLIELRKVELLEEIKDYLKILTENQF